MASTLFNILYFIYLIYALSFLYSTILYSFYCIGSKKNINFGISKNLKNYLITIYRFLFTFAFSLIFTLFLVFFCFYFLFRH